MKYIKKKLMGMVLFSILSIEASYAVPGEGETPPDNKKSADQSNQGNRGSKMPQKVGLVPEFNSEKVIQEKPVPQKKTEKIEKIEQTQKIEQTEKTGADAPQKMKKSNKTEPKKSESENDKDALIQQLKKEIELYKEKMEKKDQEIKALTKERDDAVSEAVNEVLEMKAQKDQEIEELKKEITLYKEKMEKKDQEIQVLKEKAIEADKISNKKLDEFNKGIQELEKNKIEISAIFLKTDKERQDLHEAAAKELESIESRIESRIEKNKKMQDLYEEAAKKTNDLFLKINEVLDKKFQPIGGLEKKHEEILGAIKNLKEKEALAKELLSMAQKYVKYKNEMRLRESIATIFYDVSAAAQNKIRVSKLQTKILNSEKGFFEENAGMAQIFQTAFDDKDWMQGYNNAINYIINEKKAPGPFSGKESKEMDFIKKNRFLFPMDLIEKCSFEKEKKIVEDNNQENKLSGTLNNSEEPIKENECLNNFQKLEKSIKKNKEMQFLYKKAENKTGQLWEKIKEALSGSKDDKDKIKSLYLNDAHVQRLKISISDIFFALSNAAYHEGQVLDFQKKIFNSEKGFFDKNKDIAKTFLTVFDDIDWIKKYNNADWIEKYNNAINYIINGKEAPGQFSGKESKERNFIKENFFLFPMDLIKECFFENSSEEKIKKIKKEE